MGGAAALSGAWTAALVAIQALAFFPPPPLDAAALAELDAQGLVRRRLSSGGLDRVVGVGLIPAPAPAVWLAVTDDKPEQGFGGLTELVFEGAWASPKLLYGYLDLPWPFQDRHWMLRIRNNAALHAQAGVWERYWTLDAGAMPLAQPQMGERYAGALMTPYNEGQWMLIPVGAQTLGVYQSRVSLGGAVPDEGVESWAMSSLRELFSDAARNAAAMAEKYGPGCTPQPDPSGRPIPCL